MAKIQETTIQIALLFGAETYAGDFDQAKDVFGRILGDNVISQNKEIPDYLPQELPRFEFQSSDRNTHLKIARNRVDLNFKNDLDQDILEKFINATISEPIEVSRIGFVSNKIFTEISNEEIIEFFRIPAVRIPPNEAQGILEATWRVNKKTTIGDYACNNIEELTSGRIEEAPAVRYLRDINTLQEVNLRYRKTDGQKILKLIKNLSTTASDNLTFEYVGPKE